MTNPPTPPVDEKEVERLMGIICSMGWLTRWTGKRIARWHLRQMQEKDREIKRLQKFHVEDIRVTNESATFHMKLCEEQRQQLAARVKLEEQLTQVVFERDEAEQAIAQAYYLVTGEVAQWHNMFGYNEACEKIDEAQGILRRAITDREKELNILRASCQKKDEALKMAPRQIAEQLAMDSAHIPIIEGVVSKILTSTQKDGK